MSRALQTALAQIDALAPIWAARRLASTVTRRALPRQCEFTTPAPLRHALPASLPSTRQHPGSPAARTLAARPRAAASTAYAPAERGDQPDQFAFQRQVWKPSRPAPKPANPKT